ncbi:hypothetical protein PsorP6_000013 [Peronosclerospora sorghi]|uniref:Uncharacterized protein n=1 Tax=Peronosclerospora sorghi TaxID=230839 RepID=A0ACC0WVK4_9STRA|nr:hypothetical protein PsorP6_000013 [Peronosclerospora sorghi]
MVSLPDETDSCSSSYISTSSDVSSVDPIGSSSMGSCVLSSGLYKLHCTLGNNETDSFSIMFVSRMQMTSCRHETAESFRWLFTCFLRAVEGKSPRTILTDQDRAMANAIAAVLPETKHAICMWHLARKFAEKFGSNFGRPVSIFREGLL